MTYATVEFPADRPESADLTDGGWEVRGGRTPVDVALGKLLDGLADPSDYGPSDGDPVACAADVAAGVLGGTVAFIRVPDPIPDDAVF